MAEQSSKLKLSLDNGASTASKTYSNILPSASDEAIKQAGEMLGDLQSRNVKRISRVDEKVLTEDTDI